MLPSVKNKAIFGILVMVRELILIQAYQLNLSILSFASLFVGMFLVYSMVALNVASRRHELAILRSVGTHSGQIFMLFIGEGMLFGLLGWILSIPLAIVIVKYLLYGVSQTITMLFVRVRVDTLVFSGWEITLSFIFTMIISMAASFIPAKERKPFNAMRI